MLAWKGNKSDWQDKIESGKGWAYGAELFLKKKFGATTGWLGYTLGWTERQFDNLNNGKNFPYRYDRRHDVSLVLTHKFRENLDVGLVWVYGTGNSISLPIASYSGLPSANPWVTDTSIEHYESRNGFRMQAYHRLDLGVNMHKEKNGGKEPGTLDFTMLIADKTLSFYTLKTSIIKPPIPIQKS